MSAFFPINPGGGAGGGQPQQGNAFVNATINGNVLVLVKGDGSSVRVDLSKIIPDVTNDLIKNITLNNNNLTLEYASGTTHDVDLKPILNAANVDYDNTTSGLQSTTTQDAIDEINNKLNDAYVSSDYTETTGEFDLIKVDGTKDTYRLAGLDRHNLFLGHNTFNEAFLLGKTPFVETSRAEETVGGHRAGVYCGYRRISTHHNNLPQGTSKYVSAIKIKVIRSFSVGEKVDGVYITEIRKTGDKATDVIGKTIVVDGSFIVEEDNDYGKCIYVPIQKSYTEDTYFLIGKTGSSALSECRYIYDAEKNDCVNNININALPAEGNVLGNVIGNGWIVIHSLVTDDINIREELKRLDDYVPISDLTTVGGQGNADKVPQLDNGGKIDISMIPDLSLNQVHVVSNKQEALQLLGGGTVDIGDVFILTDNQNSVHMYVNQAGTDFDDKCVELTMSNGTIVSINKTYADATGNINLSLEINGDDLEFKVENVAKSTLGLYTDNDANDLIRYFV